ncbi:MAG TPA: cytochrome c oxidase assembly protein [Tepidisphaeraceae bacterium]|nr:cytochrome c oxidase assembly protein [Tepidisphaeraceae bacterium]
MMTSHRILTELWNWHSPAWGIALIAIIVYVGDVYRRGASALQIGLFITAVVTFIIALASPLAALASRFLFSAHMAQHLLLLLIVPLCAILAWPSTQNAAAHRASSIRYSFGWLAGVSAMWFWHIPALCTAAMSSPVVFAVQVISLVGCGAAFWWPVFSPNVERRMPPHIAAGYLFAGCVGCSLLGIYITFSPVSVCPLYAMMTADSTGVLSVVREQWGLTHRIDQQVGGLLMWVPACVVYLSAILASLATWYRTPELRKST